MRIPDEVMASFKQSAKESGVVFYGVTNYKGTLDEFREYLRTHYTESYVNAFNGEMKVLHANEELVLDLKTNDDESTVFIEDVDRIIVGLHSFSVMCNY